MSQHLRWLVFVILLTVFCFYVALPADVKGVTPDDPICAEWKIDHTINTGDVRCSESIALDINNDREPDIGLNITQSLGLDLVGGLRVLLEADIPVGTFSAEDLAETANNVDRRVNALGLTEATVQVQGANRILVELPGVRDRQQAIDTIQQTALLEFVNFADVAANAQQYVGRSILTTEQVNLESLRGDSQTDTEAPTEERLPDPTTNAPFETVMTGAGLQAASAQFAALSQTSAPSWFISFEIDPDYQQVFGAFTGANIGKPMAIVLDGQVISAPVIQAQLTSGGVITGDFTGAEASTLALQLRSGALPIPLSVKSAEEVGATLGQESVNLSVRAGVVG
ncbi:MAG: hypothetical protein KC615_16095, partial [Anaerolineae bacterium]|nr:hypothetical protein [Anaerolineae bacterium]